MISIETDARIVRLILAIAKEEKAIEVVRQVLAQQPRFEPYAAFQRLDRHYRGYLTSADIKTFLADNGIDINEKSAFYVLKHYDKDQDGKLSFKEFLAAILPLNNTELRSEATQREPYKVGPKETLPYDVEYTLARVLHKEVQMHKELEGIKEDLVARHDFNLLEAFKNIDIHHARFIDFENLSWYLQRSGALFQEEDVVAYIRRLDRDLDCKVSYMEFMDGMLPVESKGKLRPSYSGATETSLLKSEKKMRTPTKFISATFQGPASASKALQRPISGLGYHASFAEPQVRKSTGGTFTTPSKSNARTSFGSKYSRGKSGERLKKLSRSEQKPVTAYRIKEAPKTPLKSILKKTGTSPYKKTSPSKSVHIKLERGEELTVPVLIKKQAEKEKLLEDLKQDIAIKKDITLGTLYRAFDPENNGYISPIDFLEGYHQFGLNPARDEVYMVFNRFDHNMDGKLAYQNICELFVPHQREYAAIFLNRNGTAKKQSSAISKESFELLRKLLQVYIDVEWDNREWKKKLTGGGLRGAFGDCDSQKKGYFDITDLGKYLAGNNIKISKIELELIMNRYDRNRNGKVTFSEVFFERVNVHSFCKN